MQLSIERKPLLAALAIAESVAERKAIVPIHSHVRLVANGDGLEITATDLYSTYRTTKAATVSKPGSCAVPARQFYSLVKALDADTVTLAVEDNEQVSITAGSGVFRIPSLAARDFPKVPEANGIAYEPFPASTLAKMLRLVESSICADQTRTSICGVLLERVGSRCRAVATNGHTMSIAEAEVPGVALVLNIPQRQAADLLRAVSEAVTVELAVGETFIVENDKKARRRHLHARIDGALLSLALRGDAKEEQFLPYEQVVPRGYDQIVTVDRVALAAALRRVSMLTPEGGGMKVDVEPDALSMQSEDESKGSAKERVVVNYDGEVTRLGINAHYLLVAVEKVETDRVRLELGRGLLPVVIRPDTGNGFVGLVMPMNLLKGA